MAVLPLRKAHAESNFNGKTLIQYSNWQNCSQIAIINPNFVHNNLQYNVIQWLFISGALKHRPLLLQNDFQNVLMLS